jgi:hypothetical protein
MIIKIQKFQVKEKKQTQILNQTQYLSLVILMATISKEKKYTKTTEQELLFLDKVKRIHSRKWFRYK